MSCGKMGGNCTAAVYVCKVVEADEANAGLDAGTPALRRRSRIAAVGMLLRWTLTSKSDFLGQMELL
jgi:hypothetical protein